MRLSLLRYFGGSIRELMRSPSIGMRRISQVLIHVIEHAKLAVKNKSLVECTICNWVGNRFFPGLDPTGLMKYDICPQCGSNDRYRLYAKFLTERTNLLQKKMSNLCLLDVAPPVYFRQFIKRYLSDNPGSAYFTISLDMSGMDVRGDLTKLCFKDNCFDFVICSHVFEHIPDDLQAMREIHRVMKPGSKALLQVPLQQDLSQTIEYGRVVESEYGHVRAYGTDYGARLIEAGFSIEVDTFSSEMSESVIQRNCLKREPLYIATCP